MRRRSQEAGYSLVLLAVLIAVMNIVVATALPLWSTYMKRQREEELIFRGLQYAEAIRVFQQRFGRLPVRLEELIETEPRTLRQLWKDPMTDSTDWGLVLATGRAGRGVAVPPGGQDLAGGREGGDKENPGDPQPDIGGPGQDPQLPRGPIMGVYSRSTEESIKTFFGRTGYNNWQFTVDLVTPGGIGGRRGGAPGQQAGAQGSPDLLAAGPPRWNADFIGRPFRPGVNAPGTQPGGGIQGGSGLAPDFRDSGGKEPSKPQSGAGRSGG